MKPVMKYQTVPESFRKEVGTCSSSMRLVLYLNALFKAVCIDKVTLSSILIFVMMVITMINSFSCLCFYHYSYSHVCHLWSPTSQAVLSCVSFIFKLNLKQATHNWTNCEQNKITPSWWNYHPSTANLTIFYDTDTCWNGKAHLNAMHVTFIVHSSPLFPPLPLRLIQRVRGFPMDNFLNHTSLKVQFEHIC